LSDRSSESFDAGVTASDTCILMLAKYPQIGLVKQRLAEDLAKGTVVGLYRRFVLDSIGTLKASGIPFSICYYPQSKLGLFRRWLGADLTYLPQHGHDLGERLKNSIADAFEMGFEKVMAIGSDSPDLPAGVLLEASAALRAHDAVIGPSTDGGYYLIGFTRQGYRPSVFEGIPWSTPEVFQNTVSRLAVAGLRVHVLRRWRDVDTMEDLRFLSKNLRDRSSYAPRTLRFIRESKVLLK
jgi:rSAM/selenodomain-associated transferase 1